VSECFFLNTVYYSAVRRISIIVPLRVSESDRRPIYR